MPNSHLRRPDIGRPRMGSLNSLSRATKVLGMSGARIVVWPLPGKWTSAPFSATTASTKVRSPATRRRSSRMRPVTRITVTLRRRASAMASSTDGGTRSLRAIVPS